MHIALGRMHVTKKTDDDVELPEDVARLLTANSPATFVSSREGLVLLFASLPWIARAQPEDLYWPAEDLKALRQKWHPEQAASVLRDTRLRRVPPRRGKGRPTMAYSAIVAAP